MWPQGLLFPLAYFASILTPGHCLGVKACALATDALSALDRLVGTTCIEDIASHRRLLQLYSEAVFHATYVQQSKLVDSDFAEGGAQALLAVLADLRHPINLLAQLSVIPHKVLGKVRFKNILCSDWCNFIVNKGLT